jgi:tetratricopeptide (TPR) repeat protein
MTRRLPWAAVAAILVCGWSGSAIHADQTTPALGDAQHDYNGGRYTRAVDTLSTAIQKTPNDAALHFLLGQSYYQLGDFPRAVASLEHAVQLAQNNSEYRDWLGKAYGRRAEESMFLSAMSWARKTHREFEIAVEMNPENFEARRDLIRYEMNAPGTVGGGDDKAMKHIDALEKINPIQGQLARGEFFSTKKRFPEADAVFDKILTSGSDKPGVYFEACDYYRDRPNGEKMAEAVEKAEQLDPEDRRLKFYKGVLLVVQKKNPAEAETLLKSYIATVPENSDLPPHAAALEWLGKLYESLGRNSEAAEQYRLSLSLAPHNKIVEDELKRTQKR